MIAFCLGVTAFVLFFAYDANSFLWQRSLPRKFFILGTCLLCIAFLLDVLASHQVQAFSRWADMPLLAAGAACFAALIYCLFFALPFEETYAKQENGRRVYDRGVYAMCRHPGILFFFGMYLFVGLAALPSHRMITHGMLFSLLNLLYAWFQDRVTFPHTFTDYHEYQQKIPFLLPTKASLRLAYRTMRRTGNEEVDS